MGIQIWLTRSFIFFIIQTLLLPWYGYVICINTNPFPWHLLTFFCLNLILVMTMDLALGVLVET